MIKQILIPQTEIYCLVRKSPDSNAVDRLMKNLDFYEITNRRENGAQQSQSLFERVVCFYITALACC